MKHTRRIATLILVLAMVMVMAISASAATIEVKNVLDDETYTAYKILNYTKSGTAYSYYLTTAEYATLGSALEAAGFAFTPSADGTQYWVNNVDTVDVAAAAESLAGATLGDALGKKVATGASGSASFTSLTPGYYFVTSTTGALCALHSDDAISTVVEKNTAPSVDKKQSATNSGYADAALDVQTGDTVYYQITVTDGKGTNKEITVTDTLTSGLTLNESITVKVGSVDVDAANYTLTKNASGFVLTLKANYVATLDEGAAVVIAYSAVVNTNVVVDNATANANTVTINYSEQEATDTVYISTYDFNLKKTDGTNALAGAQFKLYDALTGGNEIILNKDTTGYYVAATGGVAIDAGDGSGVNIRGLKPGKYYLEETVTPAGYNALAERKEVEITTGATAAVNFTVVNNKGAELPSTGGIGTTIFYVLGGLMAVGALVILVTNKRMRGTN